MTLLVPVRQIPFKEFYNNWTVAELLVTYFILAGDAKSPPRPLLKALVLRKIISTDKYKTLYT